MSQQPTTYPLMYIPHRPNENINYMRHTIKEWDIGKLKDPIYFYQPTVMPTPDGGKVKVSDNKNKRRNNKEFIDIRKEFIKKPEEENWFMYTNDGRVFKGSKDTLSDANFAVLVHDNSKFTIQLIDMSIRVKDELNLDGDIDIDTIMKQQKRENERKQQMIQKNFKFIAEDIDRKERLRKLQAKELAEAGGEDVVDSEGDGEGDDEVGADVSDVFDDDEEIDPETLLDEISEVSDFNKSDFDDDSEEEEKKEKKPKEEITTPTVNENGQVMTAEEINQNVVISILGEEVIKDDEVVRYMRDVGAATAKQLMAKFKPKLKTEAQKQAFKKIVVKRLQSFQLSGVMHYKLRSNRK